MYNEELIYYIFESILSLKTTSLEQCTLYQHGDNVSALMVIKGAYKHYRFLSRGKKPEVTISQVKPAVPPWSGCSTNIIVIVSNRERIRAHAQYTLQYKFGSVKTG